MIIGPQGEYGRGRLMKYTASSSNGRHQLVVTVEYSDPTEMGFDVSGLDDTLRHDRALDAERKAAAKRPRKPLALPAPGDFSP